MKKSFFSYPTFASYQSGDRENPSVSLIALSEVKYNGENTILDYTFQNCEIGDIIVFDKTNLIHKILKYRTFNPSTFNTDQYVLGQSCYFGAQNGYGKFLYKIAGTSALWGAQSEYMLSNIDLTQAGSFSFLSNGYQAASSATTISWDAGATLASVRDQFTTGNGGVIGSASYSSAVIEGNNIVFMIGGTGTNTITISDKTGGAAGMTLLDCTETVKINGTQSATTSHRGFEGQTVATCFAEVSSQLLPVTSASYTRYGVNRPYRCGVNFTKFKSYVAGNGAATFVDDSTSGSTWPMKQSVFAACATSAVDAEKACYERNNGSWDNYLNNAMIDIDSFYGTVGQAYGNNGKQGKLLASAFYKNRNNEWTPAYPAPYNASLLGFTTDGYTTGFEPGNFYLPDSSEGAMFMLDDTMTTLNTVFSMLGSESALSNSSYLWFSSGYSGSDAWLYDGAYGYLYDRNKMFSLGVRGVLALKFVA